MRLCAVPGRVWPIALAGGQALNGLTWTEVGLYWEITSGHRRQGFASEAGRALLDYGFEHLRLRRIVAMTQYDNTASIGVMRKLGMRIEHNMLQDPPSLLVVGILKKEITTTRQSCESRNPSGKLVFIAIRMDSCFRGITVSSSKEVAMCRSIKQLRRPDQPPTDEEIEAAALQIRAQSEWLSRTFRCKPTGVRECRSRHRPTQTQFLWIIS